MARWSGDPEVPVSETIEGSNTLSARYYTDPSVLNHEREEVFTRSWMYAGATTQVAEPGDFFTKEIGRDCIIVTRDEDGELHAFHNVCPHRGSRVVDDDAGRSRKLQCPYHGWTFDLDGALYSAPNFDPDALDPAANRLQDVAVDTWGPMIFVNLDADPEPLSRALDDLPATIEPFELDQLEYVDSYEYGIDCNWKVYVDNYIECDHCDLNHATSLYEWIDADTYTIEAHENHVRISATLQDEYVLNDDLDETVRDQYYAAWIWPNLTIDIANDGLEVGYLKPLGPERMVLQADQYTRFGTGSAGWETDDNIGRAVLVEDAELCERQQAGLRSTAFQQGRIGPAEHGIHRFQTLVQDRLEV
jgi:phenylpropionate dioxygenase-like ring-hydroxylating dioxygenase large terminal subunit